MRTMRSLQAIAMVDEPPAAAAPRGHVAALLASLVTVMLWGSAFVAIRAAGKVMSPGTIALGRLFVSISILSIIAVARREPLPSRDTLPRVGAYGVLWLGVYSVSLNEAERRVEAGTAAILAYSAAVVVQKPILTRATPFQVTWLGCAAATAACLPFAPLLVREATEANATAILYIVYLSIAPTTIGFVTWTFALQRTSAGRMGAILYLIPPITVLLGWAVLGETPQWLAVAGGALCLGGVYLARRE